MEKKTKKELSKKQRKCCSGGRSRSRFNVMYICNSWEFKGKRTGGVARKCTNCKHMKNNGEPYCDLGKQ